VTGPDVECGTEPNPIAHRTGRIPGWEVLIVHTPDHSIHPRRYLRKFFSEDDLRMFPRPRTLVNQVVLDMVDDIGMPADE
jgi:hypothetical protein